MAKKKKQITLDDLAVMMKKGFDENTEEFGSTNKRVDTTARRVDTAIGLIKLTRMEMAKDEDLQAVKTTVNTIYEMLDDEARFIELMRAEYPVIVKRLERIEKKLGLPHRITEEK